MALDKLTEMQTKNNELSRKNAQLEQQILNSEQTLSEILDANQRESMQMKCEVIFQKNVKIFFSLKLKLDV